jgi:diguanylate cyclase (GGDEF)-like protein
MNRRLHTPMIQDVPIEAAGRARGIRRKLAVAFISVACFVAAFVVVVIRIYDSSIERAALIEAEHVAEMVASSATEIGLDNSDRLQHYIADLNLLRKRDVVILDLNRKGIADADPRDIGNTFTHDHENEVGKTINDGLTRTFVERNESHPEGANQLVVPLQQRGANKTGPIMGAVILEYTLIRAELFAAERNALYSIIGLGAAVVLVVTMFGLAFAKRIAQPLRDLTIGLERIAAEDYATRVAITSQDEIGTLGLAFNRMAADLSVSHDALVQRTVELGNANTHLKEEVREREIAAERIEYLAYYDSLTALPNRSLFSKLLSQALVLARRYGTQLAVVFVDLDRFKNINDTLGHHAGDLLLQEMANRFKSCLRESDVVARLGGDEFVVLLPNLGGTSDVEVVARKLLHVASKSFTALGQEFHVTASIGVSTFPKDGENEPLLMTHADIAMYQAKEEGKNNFQFYSEKRNAHSFERLALESSLRRALEHGEFELHYQPKIDLHSDRIVGTEALLRWVHPDLGMVAPAKFIPVAEETGLIVSIGKWVLRTACAQNVVWQKAGLPHLSMAVNLSARQFLDENLLHDVASILGETGMNPMLLELEITESMLMYNVDKAMAILQEFRNLGVRLAIDDFGTGYSSLSNLKRFPIDTIKVDRSFIRDLPGDPENRGITEAIIAMGRALSLTVVAEGVETKEQAEYLREHACDEFQGFYFSKAVTASKFAELLETDMTAVREPGALTPA